MSDIDCKFWREYDSVAGPIGFCEVEAFGRQLSPEELTAAGCTPEKRKQCCRAMELSVGQSRVPNLPPPRMVATACCDSPPEIAAAVVATGEKKARTPWPALAVLGLLAGAYIGLGAELSTVVTYDVAGFLGSGLARLVGGLVFSLGLILVVIGGAELFTGNNLMVTAWLRRRVSTAGLLRNWALVYLFNFVGALLMVGIMYGTGLWQVGGGAVGAKAVAVAAGKVDLTWGQAFFRAVGCNWLVCLAVWLAAGSRDVVGKVLAIVFPVTAFVASGFEHSIANMYFIPMGILLKSQVAVAGVGAVPAALTWGGFLWRNLIPVTLGNIVGGGVFVATSYYLAYLRQTAAQTGPVSHPGTAVAPVRAAGSRAARPARTYSQAP